MTWGTVATIGGSIIGGYISSKGAQSAADTQSASAREAIQQQREMFDIQNKQQAPYREAGYTALNDIASMKPYLTKQYGAEDFAVDPSYQFRLQQGNLATQNLQNASGGAVGGNTLKALTDYNQGAASTEYGNAFNRFQTQRSNIYNTLAGIAGIGQTAQGQTNQLAQNVAGNIGQATIGSANAQAAGQIGAANAYGGGIQNAANMYSMSQYLRPTGATPVNSMVQNGAGQVDLANPFAGAKLPSYSAG
jgi:hypothetical protein